MDERTYRLKYLDRRPVCLPFLEYYDEDVNFPSDKNIKVTESERIALLKMKNGDQLCWQEVQNEYR